MTEIYLGNPPPNTKKWIEENMEEEPPFVAEPVHQRITRVFTDWGYEATLITDIIWTAEHQLDRIELTLDGNRLDIIEYNNTYTQDSTAEFTDDDGRWIHLDGLPTSIFLHETRQDVVYIEDDINAKITADTTHVDITSTDTSNSTFEIIDMQVL